MKLFGKDKDESVNTDQADDGFDLDITEPGKPETLADAIPLVEAPEMELSTLFTLHTAIDCIRYGNKSAAFSKDLPIIGVPDVTGFAYSVIMMFERNFCESYMDTDGNWQNRGDGLYGLVTPLYIRLKNQADAAMDYTNQVFKIDPPSIAQIQAVLSYCQIKGTSVPKVITENYKFSEMHVGFQEYVAFQTNVAINHAIKAFKDNKYRFLKKSSLISADVDDLVSLKIYEKGEMPKAPTPDSGEIAAFATPDADFQSSGEIEVETSDLHALITAQENLAIWWNLFDKSSDKKNLIEIMSNEAREFLKEKEKNPQTAGFVVAS